MSRPRAHSPITSEADGKPWSKGHIDNHAMRLVAKAILRDLYETVGPNSIVFFQFRDPVAREELWQRLRDFLNA